MKKRKKWIAIGILFMLIASGYVMWWIDYNSDKVEVSILDSYKKSAYSEKQEIINGRININSATTEALQMLDGVGEKTAQKIIDYRTENGGFDTIEEIKEVSGIGEGKFTAIKDQICVADQ